MAIKSDRWIKAQCTSPTCAVGRLQDDGSIKWVYSILTPADVLRQNCEHTEPTRFTRHMFLHSRPLTDKEREDWRPMISPFEPSQVRSRQRPGFEPLAVNGEYAGNIPTVGELEKVISYGTSSYGYDIRAGSKFRIFTNINSTVVDPKNFDPSCFVDVEGPHCIIPPNSFALAASVEYLRIPRDVLTVCLGKSTYARCGIIVNVTPLEPEWEGFITLEFSNTTPLPAKIYANEGVAQLLFFQSDEACATSYKDRGGKYQCQGSDPTLPRV